MAWFEKKVRDRGLDFGILVCGRGITGDPNDLTSARQTVADALRDGRRLLVIEVDEILTLEHTDQLIRLMKTKLVELALNRAGL